MNTAYDTRPDAVSSITVADSPAVIGRGREATVRLLQPTISRKHATVRRSDGGYVIEDHDSKYGTFVNGHRVHVGRVQPGDRVQFGTSVFFRVTEAGLECDQTPKGFTLVAECVSVARDDRVLVRDADFRIPADSFVAILGPSGAGKSTLLNCLATHLTLGKGRILFDNDDVATHPDEYRAALAHVPQADIVYRSLTVRENVTFAARLRLGGGAQGPHLAKVVDRVLRLVDLAEKADEQVSRLSGGQSKRVSVAIELVRRPRLLLLDEPTSGLDPATEAHLMEQLRYISRRGTTVVCTTHMMQNIHLLDLLIVLGRKNNEGRVAYVGPPSGLLAHFQCQNLADLYEKLDDGRFDVAGGDAPTRDDGPSGLDAQAVSTPVPGVTFVAPKHDSGEVAPSKRLKTKQLASPPNLTPWTQLAMICERAGLLIQRDTQLIASLAIQPVVLGLLVCLTQYNASRLVSLLLFAIVIAIWLGLNNSARELVRERKHYIRDRLAGLQPSVYLAGKVIVHSVIGAAQIVLLLLVIRVVAVPLLDAVGRKPQADDLRHTSFLWLFLVLTTCYVGALGMGLTISALVKTQETAVAVLPMLIMPQLLISVVGTLQIEEVYSSRAEPRPFRPLLAKLHADESLPMAAAGLDLASLVCLTRPAVLLAVKPAPSVPPEVGKAFWLVDLLHLLILVQAIWVSTWLAFTWAEQRWAGEPDVG